MDDFQPTDCGKLHRLHLLDRPIPPTFGHAKRAEVALDTLCKNFSPELTEACEHLILRLAQQIHDTSPQAAPFTASLVDLESFLAPLELSPAAQLLCYAARSLYGELTPLNSIRIAEARESLDAGFASVTTLLAVGLFNTLVYAKQENVLQRRDDLLQDLRDLRRSHPDDAIWQQIAGRLNLDEEQA